jgi:hypothetical protein
MDRSTSDGDVDDGITFESLADVEVKFGLVRRSKKAGRIGFGPATTADTGPSP